MNNEFFFGYYGLTFLIKKQLEFFKAQSHSNTKICLQAPLKSTNIECQRAWWTFYLYLWFLEGYPLIFCCEVVSWPQRGLVQNYFCFWWSIKMGWERNIRFKNTFVSFEKAFALFGELADALEIWSCMCDKISCPKKAYNTKNKPYFA